MIHTTNRYFETEQDYLMEMNECDTMNGIVVFVLNAQSCANLKTFDELKLLIVNSERKIDIIVVGETWIRSTETSLYHIDGYYGIHSCRANRRGGGLFIFVKQEYKMTDFVVVENDINLASVELNNIKGLKKFHLIGVYRPPDNRNYQRTMLALESLLANKMGKNIMVV